MLVDMSINGLMGLLLLFFAFFLGHGALYFCGAFSVIREEYKSHHLNIFFALSLGLLIIILALMILGYLGWLNLFGVGVTGVSLLALSLCKAKFSMNRIFSFSIIESVAIALVFLATIVFSWHMPGHWDDTSFHLPLARYYLEHEAIILHEYLRFPLFPQNMNMLITLGLMLGDAITAQLFATLPWFVITIGLMGVCKQFMGSSLLGILIAIVAIKAVGIIKPGFGYAYVDVGLAMFCWAALLAVLRYWSCIKSNQTNRISWLIIAGFLAGAAAGTKLFGGVFAFMLLFAILFISRSFKSAVAFSIAVLSTGIWWYLRSYLISGDPFHPAGGDFFGYFLWNQEDLLSQIRSQQKFSVSSNPLEIFAVLQKMHAELFLLAFIGLLFKGIPVVVRLMQLIFLGYFCFWFFVAQIERYLAPVVVLGSFLAFYTVFFGATTVVRKMQIHVSSSVAAAAVFLPAAFIVTLFIILVKEMNLASERFGAGLHDIPGYELFTKASELTASHGNNMVQVGFENATYFFTGTAIGDWFGIARYSQMLDCNTRPCVVQDQNHLAAVVDKFEARLLVVSFMRYPTFNPEEYTKEFEIIMSTSQGALLARK